MPPVVQTLDKDIHGINHYSLGSGEVLRRETTCVMLSTEKSNFKRYIHLWTT